MGRSLYRLPTCCCEDRKPGDKQCPDGEVLRRVFNPPLEDCIKNEVGQEEKNLPPELPVPSSTPSEGFYPDD